MPRERERERTWRDILKHFSKGEKKEKWLETILLLENFFSKHSQIAYQFSSLQENRTES